MHILQLVHIHALALPTTLLNQAIAADLAFAALKLRSR